MSWRREDPVRAQCYPASKSIFVRAAGGILIAAGAVMILFCVPIWAWLAAIGAALIVIGVMMIQK